MPESYADELAAPFDPREVKWKPQMVKQNRCLAIAYIDARLVMDRLDEVVGVGHWQDRYEVLGDGSVICTLRVKFPAPDATGTSGDWIEKQDVGSLSEQPDAGDRLKSAFSDALKRAAVKFGIGRYLYRLPSQWVDYDPVKKMIVQAPRLPDWAIPGKRTDHREDRHRDVHPDSPEANGTVQPGKVNRDSSVVDAAMVQKWKNWFANTPSLDAVNGNLKQLDKMPDKYTQRAVWNLFTGYAQEHGWEYSDQLKAFVPPVDVTGGEEGGGDGGAGDDQRIPF